MKIELKNSTGKFLVVDVKLVYEFRTSASIELDTNKLPHKVVVDVKKVE